MVSRAPLLASLLFGGLGFCALDPGPASASPLVMVDGSAQCRLPTQPLNDTGRLPPPPPVRAPVEPPCPREMSQIGAFCVDRHEAHLVSVAADGKETKHPYYERPERGVHYQARSAAGEYPQAYVSRIEAEDACKNAGKRLCSYGEWRRACQGARWQSFPYGATERDGVCNTGKEHLFGKIFGYNPANWVHSAFNSPKLNKEPGFLTKTGELTECRSEDGIYDMLGNVHEWVSDRVTTRFVETIKTDGHVRHDQPWKPGNAMFLGGFYATTNEHGPGCHFVTVAHNRRYHDYTTGFRCCADARTES
jgi:sulfatase modifying factor 1